MAATGTISAQAQIEGLPLGEELAGPLSVISTAALGVVSTLILAAGVNTVTVPAGATAVMIVQPATGTNAASLRGVSGDTGVALTASGLAAVLAFGSAAPASIVINSAGANSAPTYFLFL